MGVKPLGCNKGEILKLTCETTRSNARRQTGSAQAKLPAEEPHEGLPEANKAAVEDDISRMKAADKGGVAIASQATHPTDTNAILANFERGVQGNLPSTVSRSLAG